MICLEFVKDTTIPSNTFIFLLSFMLWFKALPISVLFNNFSSSCFHVVVVHGTANKLILSVRMHSVLFTAIALY